MAVKKKDRPLEDKLVLFKYFMDQLGLKELKNVSSVLNNQDREGLDDNGQTWFFSYLKRNRDCKINVDQLRQYDDNICNHVNRIGKKRGGLTLKYFQYFPLLFTEIYLDEYFSNRKVLADDLNKYIEKTNLRSDLETYDQDEMNKLAYMSATGSGKTLIMHINILQYQHYLAKAQKLDPNLQINRIILLSPNESMSRQHEKELKESSIPCSMFDKNRVADKNRVVIIDINKFDEDQGIKTVAIDSFESNNLVLVDEGHRGIAADGVWYDYRTRLSENGFSFEYSATFKQALRPTKSNSALIRSYSKSIIFDYSYKYFHGDGYGKEYRIFNLKNSNVTDHMVTYMTGGLMTYYKQKKVYLNNRTEFADFKIEDPLLVFVGNRVNKSMTKIEMSDVEEVLRFLDDFISSRDKFIRIISNILESNTGIINIEGNEIFAGEFNVLFKMFGSDTDDIPSKIYSDLLNSVFKTKSAGGSRLHLVNFKRTQEIGIRVGGTGEFFGLINVGDPDTLKSSCDNIGLITENDNIESKPFFDTINAQGSPINILIGSRKFTEGWNSWRVSTIGLINFAKGEGSQAIQMFGRGVRLRGYKGCLKRSSALTEYLRIPNNINVVETLNIFGVRAQYMEDFKEHLESEGVSANEVTDTIFIPVTSRFNEVRNEGLKVIRVRPDANFSKLSGCFILDVPGPDDVRLIESFRKHPLELDCRSRVESQESKAKQVNLLKNPIELRTLRGKVLEVMDYDVIYSELLLHKKNKGYGLLILDPSRFRLILESDEIYGLIISERYLKIDSMESIEILTFFATLVLKMYMDRFYKYEKEKWEDEYLEYRELEENDPNFVEEYRVSLTRKGEYDPVTNSILEFISGIDISKISEGHMGSIEDGVIFFDIPEHLYTPLIYLHEGFSLINVMPTNLNSGETAFLDNLHSHLESNKEKYKGTAFFILRNKSKSGIGFFEAGNFYPDFILWIKRGNMQHITFVDPKGLYFVPKNDPKIEFHKRIKNIQKRLNNTNIILNSFILAITESSFVCSAYEMSKDELEERHILFLKDDKEKCIENMLNTILNDDGSLL